MRNLMLDTFYKQRAEFEQTTAARAATLQFPDDIIEIADIPYSDDGIPAHRLDIFRPKNREGDILPVIIDVHGGGMILGNKEFNRYFCAQLSARGYLVFSVEFRLVPEYQAYDQYADISMAMDFIGNILPQYLGDPNHIYLTADSGGANLSVYTIAMQQSDALAKAAGVTPSSLKVRALGLISGMFYTDKFDEIGLFMPKYLYGSNYKKSAFAPYVNPEHPDIIKALPPCYLITSHNDSLQHYTLHFEKALSKHRVPHRLANYPKDKRMPHAFCVFEPFWDKSIQAMESMLDFLCQY